MARILSFILSLFRPPLCLPSSSPLFPEKKNKIVRVGNMFTVTRKTQVVQSLVGYVSHGSIAFCVEISIKSHKSFDPYFYLIQFFSYSKPKLKVLADL